MNEQNKRILELLSEGKALKEIASEMNMHIKTVEKRLNKMRKKNKCVNRMELAMKFVTGELTLMV
jgi:DNA-binding NarL/FixJ family response regulator